MFLWIRDQKWLPALYLSLTTLLILGGLDYFFQGALAAVSASLIALSIIFSRAVPWLSIGFVFVGLLAPTFLGLEPQISIIGASVNLLVLAAFANKIQRRVGFTGNIVLSSTGFLFFIANLVPSKTIYGLLVPTDNSKIALSVIGILALASLNVNAWFIGRYVFTSITHVGSEIDLANLESQISAAQIQLAEDGRRFGIARDVTDLLLEKVSATMVTVESSSYAIKADPTVTPRLLESVSIAIRDAFEEIRRLSDLLSLQEAKSIALPGIRDLNSLFVTYRELGFNVNFRENGKRIDLVHNASLVVYRIVSETLYNVRQHAPVNTGIDVDFIWTETALQILIKDNGEETMKANSGDATSYSVADDQQALTQRPTGAGLAALADLAKLYDATIEFARVPGVGFKVSAAFPDVLKYSKGK